MRWRLRPASGGDERDRTADPLLARQVLSQLSYTPMCGFASTEPWKNNQSLSFMTLAFVRALEVFFVHLRKEVIQPHLPIRLPCYDFTPVIDPTFGACLLAVSSATSGITNFHGVTGGVYKTRERIHRDVLIRDY